MLHFILQKRVIFSCVLIPYRIQLVLRRTFSKLQHYSIINRQHVPLTWIRSSMFGTHSDDALQRDLDLTFIVRVLKIVIFVEWNNNPENLSIMSSNAWNTNVWQCTVLSFIWYQIVALNNFFTFYSSFC